MQTRFRKSTTVVKHTGLNESDDSAESENEGATSDNPSDNNSGGVSKGMKRRGVAPYVIDAEQDAELCIMCIYVCMYFLLCAPIRHFSDEASWE